LVDAIAEIGISDALKTRLKAAETERAQLLTAKAPKPKLLGSGAEVLSRYRRLIGDLDIALARDSAKARVLLRDLLGQVRLTRSVEGLFAEYEAHPDRLLLSIGVSDVDSKSGCGGRI